MAIRTWSFAKLWAVAAVIWVVAFSVRDLLDYFDLGNFLPFAIAAIPAFLAGAWAGTHPEIVEWPRARLGALWGFTAAAFFGVSGCVGHWRALAVALAAPAAVLSLRWYELTQGRPTLRQGPATIVPPPPPPPPPQLPGGSS
jgi:hypothetical protein